MSGHGGSQVDRCSEINDPLEQDVEERLIDALTWMFFKLV